MKASPSPAARATGHWLHFFRTRDAALALAESGAAGLRHTAAGRADDDDYAPTEWAETEWPDTQIDPACSGGSR